MSKQTEALKLALEALTHFEKAGLATLKTVDAITAIREALTQPQEKYQYGTPLLDAMTGKTEQPAIKQDLTPEQPAQQQEPVVWMYVNRSTHETVFQKHMRSFVDHSQWKEAPLYGEPLANHELQCVCGAVWCGDEMVHLPDKRPPASKPLTDEQIGMAFRKAFPVGGVVFTNGAIGFARAIEAAHGIKGDA